MNQTRNRAVRGMAVLWALCTALLLGACAVAPGEAGPVFVPVLIPVPVETVSDHPPSQRPPHDRPPYERPPHEQQPYRPPVEAGPLVCGVGQQACRGPYGSLCYSPSKGERCTQGVVCGVGQQACVGRYGALCYAPSRAQTCQEGVVCGMGQRVCARGREARCYTPSKGETCQ